jgi:acid stress-induced BolA-like protein IbaG/YrbA
MSIENDISQALLAKIPEARVEVSAGSGGHFSIKIAAASFAGMSSLQKQRTVLTAIAHLMKGERAPVHAVDSIVATTE